MKVKNKLRLGFGFLFAVVLFFGMVSMFYLNQISNNAKVILKDNYESLNYCREMRTVLDENATPLNQPAIDEFNRQLSGEEKNITEPGEKPAVVNLRSAFNNLQKNELLAEKQMRRYLREIEVINMRAIVAKNEKAQASVEDSTLFLGFAGAFTFLALFTFSVNFPGFIINPLQRLQAGIKAISEKNYNERIYFDKDDEFAEVANAFNEMVSRLKEWENSNVSKIVSEKLRIETIIEQMHDAIIGVNEKHEILFINTAAKKVLSLNIDKPEGRLVDEIAQGNDLLSNIIAVDKSNKLFKIVIEGRDSHFQLETREIAVPNLNPDPAQPLNISKKQVGKVYILKNITEFKERDEAKTNFIATISHELKTPISSIKMSLKLMRDNRVGEMNSEQKQLLDHIADDSDRLLKITGELLDLSQVETGNIQLNFVPVAPGQIIDYAVSAVIFQADQKNVKLNVIKNDNLPMLNVDVEKTAWVLVNFLSNALRYSPEKSTITIHVKSIGNEVQFSVTDEGKGIEEQYQKRLFDRYFQVPTDGQNKAGTGLGLAIAKDFIEAQQGEIWVKSAIGEGSTF